jgi:hypothetical protein
VTAPLPPLPPAIRTGAGDRPAGRGMLDLLVDQHHELRVLCVDLGDLAGPAQRRRRVAEVLVAALARHLSAEEQYLYPTVRAVLPDGGTMADHEIVADLQIRRTLRRLHRGRPGENGYERLVHALGAQVARHVDEASRRIFPRLRRACTEGELVRLGNRIEIAREAAPTRPHPSTPARPPWNKVVDPGLGVVDKLRDALSRRPTYRADL